jgi:hypothetical protein
VAKLDIDTGRDHIDDILYLAELDFRIFRVQLVVKDGRLVRVIIECFCHHRFLVDGWWQKTVDSESRLPRTCSPKQVHSSFFSELQRLELFLFLLCLQNLQTAFDLRIVEELRWIVIEIIPGQKVSIHKFLHFVQFELRPMIL